MMKKTLNCRGRLLDLSTPAVMGILNLTPDSFYDGGNPFDEKYILTKAEKMLLEGADILDIGGQSTRPGAVRISAEEEWFRIQKPLKAIVRKFPEAIVSIDTFYSAVAGNALQEGASIINDVSAGEIDKGMFEFIAKSNIPYVLMHMQGTPENMQENPHYENVVRDILRFFVVKSNELLKLGVKDIIIDPGFGFGKTLEHNYALLKNLSLFSILNHPILAGLSRKSMITKVLHLKSENALNGTTVLNTLALFNHASILRVHDVKEAIEVRNLVSMYFNSKQI